MPAFAPTERPLSDGGAAAASAVDEADSVEDAFVPELVSEVVLDAEEVEDVSVASEAVEEAVELASVVAALVVEVSVSEVAVSAETEVGSVAVVGVVVVSDSAVVVGGGGVVAVVSGVGSGAAAVVPVAFRQKPLAYSTAAAESSAGHD